ncbi:MAG: M48 family metallopeptidase, partial [Casimicrobium sp.]
MNESNEPTAAGYEAIRFDGCHAEGRRVRVEYIRDHWQVTSDDGDVEQVPVTQVRCIDDTDRSIRTLQLSDGTQIHLVAPLTRTDDKREVRDSLAVNRWIREPRNGWFSSLGVILVPAFLMLFAIPGAVNFLAPRIPVAFEAKLGAVVLDSVSKSMLKPTQLPSETRDRLTHRFDSLYEAAGLPSAQLVFLRGTPNAFALPGAIVVITDELVHLLGNDDRIAAVLAHELGHLKHRHSLRNVATQLLASQVLTAAMSRDQLSAKVVDLLAQNLLSAKYSQDAEREADRFACELLAKVKTTPNRLAEGFERFAQEAK